MSSFNRLCHSPRHLFAIACLTIAGCGLVTPQCWAQSWVAPTDVAWRGGVLHDVLSGGHRLDAGPQVSASPDPAPEKALARPNRAAWAVESSIGTKSLGAGVISAAWGVARDSPDEYGANWRGFGKRYGLRLSGVAIGNSIEAGLGGLWDEDPRYERAGEGPFWKRVARAGKWTVLSRHADGGMRPAYARGIGIVSNNFITNAWRVESDSSIADALSRSAVGVSSRCVSNLFDEFWPDIRRVVLRR